MHHELWTAFVSQKSATGRDSMKSPAVRAWSHGAETDVAIIGLHIYTTCIKYLFVSAQETVYFITCQVRVYFETVCRYHPGLIRLQN